MIRRLVVLTATDRPAVQDAVVNFGHAVHPQPPAPDNHIVHPNDLTIFKGGNVTFTMHGVTVYSHGTVRQWFARGQPAPGNHAPDVDSSGTTIVVKGS